MVGVAVFVNVLVGGTGVLVNVFVAVAVFVGVNVKVLVGVVVGVKVFVGGTGVFVNVFVATTVFVGVHVFVLVGVAVLAIGVAVGEPESKLNAANKSIRPYPYVLSAPAVPRSTAELIKAFSCSAAVRLGKAERRRASPPATCGAERDVPEGLL